MKFSEKQQQLLQLAFDKAEHDAEFTITSIHLDGVLRKGGAKARLTIEPPPPPPPKPSSFGRVVAVVFCGCFVLFVFAGVVGSQHEAAPQPQQPALVTPSPSPSPGN
jgi:hypothetical protein